MKILKIFYSILTEKSRINDNDIRMNDKMLKLTILLLKLTVITLKLTIKCEDERFCSSESFILAAVITAGLIPLKALFSFQSDITQSTDYTIFLTGLNT